MKTFINTQVKNEALLLEKVLPFWKMYPVERFVFYNDGSTDKTTDVISDILGDRAKIVNPEDKPSHDPHMSADYNEAHMRYAMMEYNKSEKADLMIALDADELISYSIVKAFDQVKQACAENSVYFYWYNVVGSLKQIRQDPAYVKNYRNFIVPLKNSTSYDLNTAQRNKKAMHETPRTPTINLPVVMADLNYGFIHLQALNTKFYALKQLFYKMFEHKEYGREAKDLLFYDQVVNNLNFCAVDTPLSIIGDWEFDGSVFDKILEIKEYKKYIKENYNPDLVTFGAEFLD